MRRRRGFTFIELLLAISVMLVLMAISMPKMAATFKRGRLEAATRKLTAPLRYARPLALLRGAGSPVRFPRTGSSGSPKTTHGRGEPNRHATCSESAPNIELGDSAARELRSTP